jgi:hypothetical protein
MNMNAAHAAYNGLTVTTVFSTVALDPLDPTTLTAVSINRVWASFTNPNDALFVWGGGGVLGTGVINNVNATGTGPGSGFLNHVFGGDMPPNSSAAVSNADTFFTIGCTLQNQIPAGQGISLLMIPGTPGGLTGNTINLSPQGGGVATTPTNSAGAPNPITLAGFTGDGDTALRVLLMQLVVRQGEHVHGTIGVTMNLGSLAGATTTIQNQAFGPLTPPPLICCQPTTCTIGISPTQCQSLGGVIATFGISCTQCNGACCASDGTCTVTSFANCAASGGTFRGYATNCLAVCTPGDIDGDNRVNLDDLLAVIKNWGACRTPCPPCPSDLNSSCTVDVDDLLYVIQHWLP